MSKVRGRYWLTESARGGLLRKRYEDIGKMVKSQAVDQVILGS